MTSLSPTLAFGYFPLKAPFKDEPGREHTKEARIFYTILNVSGYIPGLSIASGLTRIFFATVEGIANLDTRTSVKAFVAVSILRGTAEILGLGILIGITLDTTVTLV